MHVIANSNEYGKKLRIDKHDASTVLKMILKIYGYGDDDYKLAVAFV